MRLLAQLLFTTLVLATSRLEGQTGSDTAGAWESARAVLLSRQYPPDSARIVSDTAVMRQRFATCDSTAALRQCVLSDNKPVFVMRIERVSQHEVVVDYLVYATFRGYCDGDQFGP